MRRLGLKGIMCHGIWDGSSDPGGDRQYRMDLSYRRIASPLYLVFFGIVCVGACKGRQEEEEAGAKEANTVLRLLAPSLLQCPNSTYECSSKHLKR